MKRLKKILRVTGYILASLLVVILVFLLIISPGSTPAFKDERGNEIENSIAEMKYVHIGGIEQFILIRGISKHNPILLVLHGGPGSPELAPFRKFNSDLEKHFIVVHWEQRGAGKSFYKNMPVSNLTLPQFIEDTHELTSYLKERFKRDKIFLLGHSWGSFLGINTVNKYPDDYYAYIGIGQIADQSKSEKLSYEFILEKAGELKNTKALKELNEIGEFSEVNLNRVGMLNWLLTEREWSIKLNGGGTVFNKSDLLDIFILSAIFNKEYTLSDKFKVFRGAKSSIINLFPTVLNTNLTETIPELKVPVYLLHGIDDHVTTYSVAKEYFDTLKAPKKEFITFNKSSHFVPFEEPEIFHDFMINEVLKESSEYKQGYTKVD